MVPVAGSAYTYAYASLGEFVAWIIGWDLIIEYAVGNIGVAIGWSGYFQELIIHFGVSLAGLAGDRLRSAHMAADAIKSRRHRPRDHVHRLRAGRRTPHLRHSPSSPTCRPS